MTVRLETVWGFENFRDEDPDPVIFGPPDPVLFSTDPDPTCNNGIIKLSKYKSESTNSSIK